MKPEIIEQINTIIDDNYKTDWEIFIEQVIVPQIPVEEIDIVEVKSILLAKLNDKYTSKAV